MFWVSWNYLVPPVPPFRLTPVCFQVKLSAVRAMTSWSARICSYLIFTCCSAVFLLTNVGETAAYMDEFVQMRNLEEISGSDGEKMMLCGSICRPHSLSKVNAQAPDSCSSCVYWVSCSYRLQPCVCVCQPVWMNYTVCLSCGFLYEASFHWFHPQMRPPRRRLSTSPASWAPSLRSSCSAHYFSSFKNLHIQDDLDTSVIWG